MASEQLSPDFRHWTFPTGAAMPMVGLGTYSNEKLNQTYNAVRVALSHGYRLIDCAFAYLNEEEIGRAIREKIEDGSVKRDEIFITDKLWCTYHQPLDVKPACQRSLKKLGLDYMDLYLIHWPCGLKKPKDHETTFFELDENGKKVFDPVPIEVTWKAMEELVDEGLCKAIGLSNFSQPQIERIQKIAKHPIANLQIESTPYLQQNKLVKFCLDNKISVTAHTPLYNPRRYWKKDDDLPSLLEHDLIKKIAGNHKKTPANVLIRFQVQRGVAVVPKSFTPSRIRENFEVFDFSLTDDEMISIRGLDKHFRSLGGFGVEGLEIHPEYPWKDEL